MFRSIKNWTSDFIQTIKKEIAGVKIQGKAVEDFSATRFYSLDFAEVPVLSPPLPEEMAPVNDGLPRELPLEIRSLTEQNATLTIESAAFTPDPLLAESASVQHPEVTLAHVPAFQPDNVCIIPLAVEQLRSLAIQESTVFFAPSFSEGSLFFRIPIKESSALIYRFPIRRTPSPKSLYSAEDIRNAVSYILERLQTVPHLELVGIYRDVPINRIRQLSFEKGKLLFTLLPPKRGRDVILDVLIVREPAEGKYHIGPIVRKA